MGLFGGSGGGRSSATKATLSSQFGINMNADDIIKRIQAIVSNNLGQSFDTSGMPSSVAPTNALQLQAQQGALGLANGTSGIGSALQQSTIDSLTKSGAEGLLDPAMFNQLFNQSVRDPAQYDFNRNLSQASNFVAGLGGERSGGFGTILGDTANEFSTNLLGQRAQMQSALAQQGAQLESQRLNRVVNGGFQAALAPQAFASEVGQQQFTNETAQTQGDLNTWLLQQPFMNPYVTTFLNTALGARDPGTVLAGG